MFCPQRWYPVRQGQIEGAKGAPFDIPSVGEGGRIAIPKEYQLNEWAGGIGKGLHFGGVAVQSL